MAPPGWARGGGSVDLLHAAEVRVWVRVRARVRVRVRVS